LAQTGADEAGRLEAALERIARASVRAAQPVPANDAAEAPTNTQELAARLDILIEELRGLLGQV
jgi:hypothetical protein